MASKSELKVVMGAMTFGAAGKEGVRVHDLKDVSKILDIFQSHGHTEVDTSRNYTETTSEQYLGELNWKERGLNVETKLYPRGYDHTAKGLREGLEQSLAALKTDTIDLWYLHGPDRSTPYFETFQAVNELHKEGKFNKLGISNYYSWEVAEIVTLCRANGWIQPTVYQGLYNAIHRIVEPELFPCLRKFGIRFYEFNPLGGGFLTGRYEGLNTEPESGSRFDTSKGTMQSRLYNRRYWNEKNFMALDILRKAAEKEGLTVAEVALRWVNHHSLLKREHGDAVIIGASSVKHIEQNLLDLEKGPLPQSVIRAVDEAWDIVKPYVAGYWH